MGDGRDTWKKRSISQKKSLFSRIFFDTEEGSLGNGKGIYKGICFFDKGGMDGWGATWKKKSLLIYVFWGKMMISVFGNMKKDILQRQSTFVKQF